MRNTTAADSCWLWKGAVNACGYGTCGELGTDKSLLAHRASYEYFIGPIQEGMHVCHTCDVPRCINPMHLFLGTHAENMADAKQKNRFGSRRGEMNSRSKLTEKDVLFIRSSPLSSGELAVHFNITQTRICQIRKGLGWKHVPMVTT